MWAELKSSIKRFELRPFTLLLIAVILQSLLLNSVKAVENAENESHEVVPILTEGSHNFTNNEKNTILLIATPLNGTELRSADAFIKWYVLGDTRIVDHYEIRVDGREWFTIDRNITYYVFQASDGYHVVYVRAVDSLGGSWTASVNFTVNASFVGGPGWNDDIAVFTSMTLIAKIAITRKEKRPVTHILLGLGIIFILTFLLTSYLGLFSIAVCISDYTSLFQTPNRIWPCQNLEGFMITTGLPDGKSFSVKVTWENSGIVAFLYFSILAGSVFNLEAPFWLKTLWLIVGFAVGLFWNILYLAIELVVAHFYGLKSLAYARYVFNRDAINFGWILSVWSLGMSSLAKFRRTDRSITPEKWNR